MLNIAYEKGSLFVKFSYYPTTKCISTTIVFVFLSVAKIWKVTFYALSSPHTLIVLSLEPEIIQSSWKSTVWESVLCILCKSRSLFPELQSNTYKLPSLSTEQMVSYCKFGYFREGFILEKLLKSSQIGEITLSFTYISKSRPCCEFQCRKYVF